MALKPWYKVVTPREDLREGRPMDASEFAVHLDQVRDGRAPDVYQRPEQFFERTYLTQNLTGLASEVVRRLSGTKTETNPVFNMSTQFGGGKTHALTLLYHLAKNGSKSESWSGVRRILEKSGMKSVPRAAVAVFVGTEFDSLSGRGGEDGTPLRKTPWGEIAFQLGGKEAFSAIKEHDEKQIAPAGDVIRKILPKDKPCLILMDELMNYVSRNRKSGLSSQLYNFLQNLSEEARGRDNTVLVVSIPASELEMTAEDQSDFERFKKVLDRLGKAVVMSAEAETSEIIRRRLFEWHGIPDDGRKTAAEYAAWVVEHRQQIPQWFDVDNAREAFEASYPFHPMVLSVFERKWQELPRFQQTRGVLRLLALWVSKAFQEGFTGNHKDALIGLGTAPLDDSLFRAAAFEQLGETKLEGAVTTDICGKKDSHATRLDKEALEDIKKARLHRKVATVVFFESNGGQARAEATVPEVRLAVAEPDLDVGNVETVLESLTDASYYLTVERNRYRFSFKENLNKRFADRRASITPKKIEERVRAEIQRVFAAGASIERVYFPEKSSQIPDRPALTLVVLPSDQDEKAIPHLVESMTKEYGASSRTFKSAIIWCAADPASGIQDEARKALAWEDIQAEEDELRLDDSQKRQLAENAKRAQRDLKESVWRTYKTLHFLGKDKKTRTVDLGLVTSSQADSMVSLVLNRLMQEGEVEKAINPGLLVRNWPPAFTEWSTKSVRDVFFSSPVFPRLLSGESVKETIARGVSNGTLAYVGKTTGGEYKPFICGANLNANEVEISDDVFIVTKEAAESYLAKKKAPTTSIGAPAATGGGSAVPTGVTGIGTVTPPTRQQELPGFEPGKAAKTLSWTGEVPPQKWTNFYMKFLSKFATAKGMKITVNVDISPEGGIPGHKIDEAKAALRELGLNDQMEMK